MGKGAPAPPGYWEPAQGPATPAGLGLGGFCTAGRVCQPPSPGTKPSFYWNFGRQNNQGLLFYRAPRGNPLRGCSRTAQLPGVPTVTTQSHKKRGKSWLWNCSRSRMGCWSRQQLTHCTPGRSSTLTQNLFPIQKLPMNSNKCSFAREQFQLEQISPKKTQYQCLEKLFGYKNL